MGQGERQGSREHNAAKVNGGAGRTHQPTVDVSVCNPCARVPLRKSLLGTKAESQNLMTGMSPSKI